MDAVVVRHRLQGLADRMGVSLPDVEPRRVAKNVDASGGAGWLAGRIQERFEAHAKIDNADYRDLDKAVGRVHLCTGRAEERSELSETGKRLDTIASYDGKPVNAESLEQDGESCSRYSLNCAQGRLLAEVVQVSNGTYSVEQWLFTGPGVRPRVAG